MLQTMQITSIRTLERCDHRHCGATHAGSADGTPHPGIKPKLGRVQLSSLQRRTQDAELGMQLRAACKVRQVSLCPLLLLQNGIAIRHGAGALHCTAEVLLEHRPLATVSRHGEDRSKAQNSAARPRPIMLSACHACTSMKMRISEKPCREVWCQHFQHAGRAQQHNDIPRA